MALQIFLLGLIYCGLALVTDSAYVLLGGGMRQLLKGRVMTGPLPRYLGGSVYIGLGIGLALSERAR